MKICISYGELKAAGLKVNAEGVRTLMGRELPEFDIDFLLDFAPLEYRDKASEVCIMLPAWEQVTVEGPY